MKKIKLVGVLVVVATFSLQSCQKSLKSEKCHLEGEWFIQSHNGTANPDGTDEYLEFVTDGDNFGTGTYSLNSPSMSFDAPFRFDIANDKLTADFGNGVEVFDIRKCSKQKLVFYDSSKDDEQVIRPIKKQ